MATLVDSIPQVDRSIRRKFKKFFESLDSQYSIRTPVLDEHLVAQMVVEGPNRSWLFLSYHKENPGQKELAKFIQFNQKLASEGFKSIYYLVISETGETMFDESGETLALRKIIEKDVFFQEGKVLINEYLTETCHMQYDYIKKTLFSESNIPPKCLSRRQTLTDSSNTRLPEIFLDLEQEIATKMDIHDDLYEASEEQENDTKVRLINGVAGSGKTLILMNRAILFARKYPHKSIVLLIHNNPIVFEIKHKIDEYMGGCPNNLKVQTFHQFALARQKEFQGTTKPIFDEKAIIEKMETTLPNSGTGFSLSKHQLFSELEFINDFLICSKTDYLSFDRHGRGFSLTQNQREVIWDIYQATANKLSDKTNGVWAGLYIKNLCIDSSSKEKIAKFDHILVDEAQFFAPSWLSLVKLSLKPGGHIFLSADPNQGFLKSRLSWKSVGMDVRGRTKKLTYSYRTTYEILLAANAILEQLNEDTDDFIKPDYKNMTKGPKPIIFYKKSPQDELKHLINIINDVVSNNKISHEDMLVLCGDNIKPWKLKQDIEEKIGPGKIINCSNKKELENGFKGKIRLMTINSCTGVEARLTLVVGVGHLINSHKNLDLNENEISDTFQSSVRKLYVAMTRSSQRLVLFSTEQLSQKVEALCDVK